LVALVFVPGHVNNLSAAIYMPVAGFPPTILLLHAEACLPKYLSGVTFTL
jgi:hypothetical protein